MVVMKLKGDSLENQPTIPELPIFAPFSPCRFSKQIDALQKAL